MSQDTMNVLLLLVPLFIGGIIAAINANQVNDATEGAEARVRGWQQRASARTGFFFHYVLNPLLWSIVKFCGLGRTDFAHRGVKNGARVARNPLSDRTLAPAPHAAVSVVIAVVILVVVLYIAAKFCRVSVTRLRPKRKLPRMKAEAPYRTYSRPRRVVGVSGKGQRVHPETGVIQEEGLVGLARHRPESRPRDRPIAGGGPDRLA